MIYSKDLLTWKVTNLKASTIWNTRLFTWREFERWLQLYKKTQLLIVGFYNILKFHQIFCISDCNNTLLGLSITIGKSNQPELFARDMIKLSDNQ